MKSVKRRKVVPGARLRHPSIRLRLLRNRPSVRLAAGRLADQICGTSRFFPLAHLKDF